MDINDTNFKRVKLNEPIQQPIVVSATKKRTSEQITKSKIKKIKEYHVFGYETFYE
jgi:hypothetical protein